MAHTLEAQPDYDADPASPWRDPAPVPVRRRLMFIAAFAALVFVADRVVAFGLGQLSARGQYRFSMLYSGRINADVVVVGNSRGMHSLFAPEMTERLGVPAFNLSLNGLGMDVLSIVVRDYLDLNRPPKMILLEITAAEARFDESAFIVQPFFDRSERLRGAVRAESAARYWACRVFHSYRYNGNELPKLLLYLRSDDQHWISPAARKIAPELLLSRELPMELKVPAKNVAAWRELLAAAKAKGVTIVPFIAPYLKGSIGGRDLRKEYESVLGAGPDDPPILDYSRAVESDDAFADRVHTNEIGARTLFGRMADDGVFRGVARPGGRPE